MNAIARNTEISSTNNKSKFQEMKEEEKISEISAK